MRPIRERQEVEATNVLYHSAFGFARVRAMDADGVALDWHHRGDNLPLRVGGDGLVRAYMLCPRGGFFDRALNSSDALRELLQVEPAESLRLLLDELDGPQSRADIRDWVTGLELLSDHAFERWWQRLQPIVTEDPRFRASADHLTLRDVDTTDVATRLANGALSAARRLDLANQHRAALGDPAWRDQVLLAWRTGGSRVRDLALAALTGVPGDVVLPGLLAPGTESIDAIVHALRHAEYQPNKVSAPTLSALLDRVVGPVARQGDPLDAEGRLAAALWRWGAPGVEDALLRVGGSSRGRELLEAALSALPPRRAETLAVAVGARAVATGADVVVAAIAAWLVDRAEDGPFAIADRLAPEHAELAARVRQELDRRVKSRPEGDDVTMDSEEGLRTAEITSEALQVPVALAQMPPVHGREFLSLGLAVARSLARHHATGRIVAPTSAGVLVHPDGHVDVLAASDPRQAPRAGGEAPSLKADLYAAGVLLVEALLGKAWPRLLAADRVIPFLRHIVQELPASALAPLVAVLDPLPQGRPADAAEWVHRWELAIAAEAQRTTAADPRLRLRVGYDTHVGRMKVLHTQTNQDALYVSSKGPQTLMVVCDGISTANTGSGDLAASITTQVVASLWEQWLPRLVQGRPEDAREFLERALRTANQAVCEASMRLGGGNLDGKVPMGSTAVVAVARGNRVSIAWLGDSRAYVVGAYGASQLTADANQAGERLVDWQRGQLGSFDATGFALVRYVGHFDESGRAEPLPPYHTEIVLLPDERLVICSDGITDYVGNTQADVAAVFTEQADGRDPDDSACALVALANRGGGGDNCTAVVATTGV